MHTIGRMVAIYTTLETVAYLLRLKTESLDNAILELRLAEPSWLKAIIPNMCNCTNKLKISCFSSKVERNSRYFVGVFNKTIIPLALVGYRMIIANSYHVHIQRAPVE